MAKKVRIAHSHEQNRKEAIPLGSCGTSSYRDYPLSDDEGDSRGRGRDKIVSHIKPFKNVNPHAGTSNRKFGGSEVVAQSSYKKNGPLFNSSRTVDPHNQGTSSPVIRKSSTDAERHQYRRSASVAGSSDSVRRSEYNGSLNRITTKNYPPLQYGVQSKIARPVPPPFPSKLTAMNGAAVSDKQSDIVSMNQASTKTNGADFHDVPGRRRFSSSSSSSKNAMDDISPLDRILPSMQSAAHPDVASHNGLSSSTRIETETGKLDSSIIKKRRVTFDDSCGKSLSTSLPVGNAIPTSVAFMDRPASCSLVEKRREQIRNGVHSVPHVKSATVCNIPASSSVEKSEKVARTTQQQAVLGSSTGLRRICYFIPKFSEGFEGSSKLAYKDQFSDVPDPYVYVRSQPTKNKVAAVGTNNVRASNIAKSCDGANDLEKGDTVLCNTRARVHPSSSSQGASIHGVTTHPVNTSSGGMGGSSNSVAPVESNIIVSQEQRRLKEEPIDEVNENIISSFQLSKTVCDVKSEPPCEIDVKKEASGTGSDEGETSKSSLNRPSYSQKIKSEKKQVHVKEELPEDDEEIVFLAHLTEEGIKEISKRIDVNVAQNGHRSASSQYIQVIPPPLLPAQWSGIGNLPTATPYYPPQHTLLPYGYNGLNYPVANWNGQLPMVPFDSSRPPPQGSQPFSPHGNSFQQYNMTGNAQCPSSAYFQQSHGSTGNRSSYYPPSNRDRGYYSSRNRRH